jgi:acetyl esterase/lipase
VKAKHRTAFGRAIGISSGGFSGKASGKAFGRALLWISLGVLPLRHAEAQFTVKAIPNLTYATVGLQPLLLDLYLPQGATAKTPVVLWIHGGAWSKTTNITKNNIGHITSVLVPKGIAVASLNYRLSEEAKWPAQIQDCKGAVRWLRANAATYNLDGSIGAWGESAGAHLAALLGTAGGVGMHTSGAYTADLEGTVGGNAGVSSRIQAVVDYYGPTDFFRSSQGAVKFGWDVTKADFPPNMLIDGFVLQNPDKCNSASSLPFVDPTDPPFMIFHGLADDQVVVEQSGYLDSALRKNAVPVKLTTFPGLGHGGAAFWSAATTTSIYDFFAKNLKPGLVGVRAGNSHERSKGTLDLGSGQKRKALGFGWNDGVWGVNGRKNTLAKRISVTTEKFD